MKCIFSLVSPHVSILAYQFTDCSYRTFVIDFLSFLSLVFFFIMFDGVEDTHLTVHNKHSKQSTLMLDRNYF